MDEEAVAPLVKQEPAPKPAADDEDDEWAVPAFLRRNKKS
jgi:hypothetical protein